MNYSLKEKINSAFCPEGNISFNPILDWVKYIIFREKDPHFLIERKAKFGGDLEFFAYQELEEAYLNKKIHPLDLKNSVSNRIIDILNPARNYFEKPKIKKMKQELEDLLITR